MIKLNNVFNTKYTQLSIHHNLKMVKFEVKKFQIMIAG